jgi:hypothetical protein
MRLFDLSNDPAKGMSNGIHAFDELRARDTFAKISFAFVDRFDEDECR